MITDFQCLDVLFPMSRKCYFLSWYYSIELNICGRHMSVCQFKNELWWRTLGATEKYIFLELIITFSFPIFSLWSHIGSGVVFWDISWVRVWTNEVQTISPERVTALGLNRAMSAFWKVPKSLWQSAFIPQYEQAPWEVIRRGMWSLWCYSEKMRPYEKWIMKAIIYTGLDHGAAVSCLTQTAAHLAQKTGHLCEWALRRITMPKHPVATVLLP